MDRGKKINRQSPWASGQAFMNKLMFTFSLSPGNSNKKSYQARGEAEVLSKGGRMRHSRRIAVKTFNVNEDDHYSEPSSSLYLLHDSLGSMFENGISDPPFLLAFTLLPIVSTPWTHFTDKEGEPVDALQGRAANQTDLDRLEEQVNHNLMKFSKEKRKVLHLRNDTGNDTGLAYTLTPRSLYDSFEPEGSSHQKNQ
ncbi:hypothetical protein HGM15179_005887 [Zosterops borbonicus]|uniref:Uncharacterized protein n=1 Tax=Zosterops borbonicus TaxID=364589 RepID=A0A8K1LPN3_9PASS|nr:hypothetical protein HGM15179_005887 [Zosterops borbonicus]